MQPFAQDRTVLQRDLRRIVGTGSLDMLQCLGSPGKTRRNERSHVWHDYEKCFAPALGACVLIVSDFGIGGSGFARGASPYAWAMLARRLTRAGHRVVGFAPYPVKRFPPNSRARSTWCSGIASRRSGGSASRAPGEHPLERGCRASDHGDGGQNAQAVDSRASFRLLCPSIRRCCARCASRCRVPT